MFGFVPPTPADVRNLIAEYWATGNDELRDILADASEDLGRHDVAHLWRRTIPNYRRRKFVAKLNARELEQIEANFEDWTYDAMLKTGETDELLAAAAIQALYSSGGNLVQYRQAMAMASPTPRVVWAPGPAGAAQIARELQNRVDWIYVVRPNFRRHISQAASDAIEQFAAPTRQLAHALTSNVTRAGDDIGLSLHTGTSVGQFDAYMAFGAAVTDVLRLSVWNDDEQLNSNAAVALARCSPYWLGFPTMIILSQHPTIISPDDQPRWAWLDDKNQPYQWPTTR